MALPTARCGPPRTPTVALQSNSPSVILSNRDLGNKSRVKTCRGKGSEGIRSEHGVTRGNAALGPRSRILRVTLDRRASVPLSPNEEVRHREEAGGRRARTPRDGRVPEGGSLGGVVRGAGGGEAVCAATVPEERHGRLVGPGHQDGSS